MATPGIQYIAAAIQNGAGSALVKLEEGLMITDQERAALAFATRYYRSHREVPTPTIIQQETGVRIPRTEGPLGFHLDNLLDRQTFSHLRDAHAGLRASLEGRNTSQAVVVLEDTLRRIRRSRPSTQLIDIHQGMGEVITRLENARNLGGISGVPTPWETFNDQSGGLQASDLMTIVGRTSMGKCMHPDTPVVMFDGRTRLIKTLKPGEQLMGPDSKPRTVLSTTTGREEMFKIVPSRGEEWVCNKSHVLVLESAYTVNTKHTEGSRHLYTVNDYLLLPERVQRSLRLVRTGVEFPRKALEFDPYILGLWLGDGALAGPRICNPEPEVIQALHAFAATEGYKITNSENREGFCPVWDISKGRGIQSPFRDFVTVDCVRSGQKRIPLVYLTGDRGQRLELLAGLVDTDGYTELDAIEITTQSTGLREDILYLARSLGLCAKWSIKTVNGKDYYRVRIIGATDMIPCRVPRKKVRAIRQRRVDPLRVAFSVVPQGEGEYFGITLSGDHLYLLGDFTVTHNTAMLLANAEAAYHAGYSVLFVTTEMGSEQIARRWMALRFGLDPEALKKGTVSTYLMRRMQSMQDELIGRERFRLLSAGTQAKVNQIEAAIEETAPDIVYIDGIYLFRPNNGGSNLKQAERVTSVFDEVKQLTIDTKLPHVVTTQFNRQAGKGGKDGSLENIGLSDAIGWHSSIVLAVRPGPTENPRDSREFEILKGREGEEGSFYTNFKFRPVDFSELSREEVQQLSGLPMINSDLGWG